jgi:hypothetical protein
VRTRCWGPRRAGARFCFRGSRGHAPVASRCRMRCLWCAVASLSCHPCSFAVSLAVMSMNLATSSCTTGLCSQNPPITAELMPPMRWIWVCIFAVGEEACSDGLAVYPVAEAVVPPREPCLTGGAGGVEVCGPAESIASLVLRHPVPARLGASMGAPTCVLSSGSPRPRWAAAKV